MFKLDLSATYYARVSIPMLDGDGRLVTHQFDACFKRRDQTELEAKAKRFETGDAGDQEIVDEELVGWRGVRDAADCELPYTPDNLAAVLRVAGMRKAIALAWWQSLSPQEAAALAEKN